MRLSVFDAHCDTIFRCNKTKESIFHCSGMISLEETEKVFDQYCQFFALFSNTKRDNSATYDQLVEYFREQMQRFSNHIVQCKTGAEAILANKVGKTAAFLTVEGGELLECKIEKLRKAAEDGVVAINLTWNHANAISGSCYEEPSRGLSDVGRSFVAEMEKLHIFPDVSHLSEVGFWDLTEITTHPIIASHSNSRAVHNHVRNLTDAQITAIIKSQGIIGLNFYREFVGGKEDFDAIRAHLDRMLELGGEDCVSLGGDWDGCETIAALPKVINLLDLYEYLMKKSYSETTLHGLFYNNLMRVVSLR